MPVVLIDAEVRRRVASWVHSEWAGVALVGVACLLKGYTYMPHLVDDGGIPAIETWVPMSLAAVMWMGVGVACLVAAVTRRGMPIGIGAGMSIHFLWGSLYLIGWITGHSPRGYVTAILYFAFVAAVMWGYTRRVEVMVRMDSRESDRA